MIQIGLKKFLQIKKVKNTVPWTYVTSNLPKFAKNVDLANWKSNVDIDKLKNVPTNLSNFKSKVDKLYIDKLIPVPVNLVYKVM